MHCLHELAENNRYLMKNCLRYLVKFQTENLSFNRQDDGRDAMQKYIWYKGVCNMRIVLSARNEVASRKHTCTKAV